MKTILFGALLLGGLGLTVGCSDNKGAGPTTQRGGIQTTLTPIPMDPVNAPSNKK